MGTRLPVRRLEKGRHEHTKAAQRLPRSAAFQVRHINETVIP